jgi:hypothetical protein
VLEVALLTDVGDVVCADQDGTLERARVDFLLVGGVRADTDDEGCGRDGVGGEQPRLRCGSVTITPAAHTASGLVATVAEGPSRWRGISRTAFAASSRRPQITTRRGARTRAVASS